MKLIFTLLITSLISASVFASEEYCQASTETTSRIDQLRVADLPFKILKLETIGTLINDRCVKSRLSDEEIDMLSRMLLAHENNQDTSKQIIGEFLAQ